MNNLLHNQKGGTAIMMTVLILSAVLTVTLAAADIVRNGLIMSQSQVNSTKAYFAAEAGAERILWELRKNNFDPGDGNGSYPECEDNPADICFNDIDPNVSVINNCIAVDTCSINNQILGNLAEYELEFSYETGPPDITILSSLGTFGDTHRNVRLKYEH